MKEGWELKNLIDVCSFENGDRGKNYPSKSKFVDSGVAFVNAGHLQKQEINMSGMNFISQDHYDLLSRGKFQKGDLLFCLRGSLGKHAVIKSEQIGAIASSLVIVRPKITTTTQFISYYFESQFCSEMIEQFRGGAAQPNLGAKDLAKFNIPIPPLAEQEAIVEVLDKAFAAIDQAKANIEQNIANTKELFQSKLNQIFSQKGDGWVETPLSDLIKVKHGFAFKSEFFTTEGEHVLLTPGNYYEEGGYRDRGAKQKYYAGEIPEGYILNQDDLLLAMAEQASGLLGSPLLVPASNRFLHNQRLGLIQHVIEQPLSNRFLFHAFNTKHFRAAIHDSGTGVKVRHTSPTKICETTITINFNTQIQEQVINTLELLKTQTDALAAGYQTKLTSLDEFKKSILQKAFKGELTN